MAGLPSAQALSSTVAAVEAQTLDIGPLVLRTLNWRLVGVAVLSGISTSPVPTWADTATAVVLAMMVTFGGGLDDGGETIVGMKAMAAVDT